MGDLWVADGDLSPSAGCPFLYIMWTKGPSDHLSLVTITMGPSWSVLTGFGFCPDQERGKFYCMEDVEILKWFTLISVTQVRNIKTLIIEIEMILATHRKTMAAQKCKDLLKSFKVDLMMLVGMQEYFS